MHTLQIQYDYLIHMQPMPFSLSTHLMHMRQICIYDPNAYLADMAFLYLHTWCICGRYSFKPVSSYLQPSTISSRHGL